MNFLKARWFFKLIIVLFLGLCAVFITNHSVSQEKIIKVGVYDNAPIVFVGKNKKIKGLSIEVLEYIASQENWRATHRLAGKLMVVFGLLLLAGNTFFVNLFLTIWLCVAPLLLPVLYSPYYYFKNEKGQQDLD